MGHAQIIPTIPVNFETHKILSISLLFWYTRVLMETVKLNIHLEQRVHFIYNWSMDYALNW
jgi:hypothetical protein